LYGNGRTITQFNSDFNPHAIGWFTFTEALVKESIKNPLVALREQGKLQNLLGFAL